jgi:hypothetical protein
MTRILVLSDTHIRRGARRRLPDQVYAELARADLVLHAGDIVVSDVLDELSGFAPTHAVLGNNDLDPGLSHLPETRVVEVDGVRIGMVHDSGPRAGRERRMRTLFPAADVVVFGHSHVPWDGFGLDGQLLFNPGSATERRAQPVHTYGVLEVDAWRVVGHAVVPVEATAEPAPA